MKTKQPVNLPASIHQRLLNQAKAEDRPLQELLQYFAMERFLFRLGRSSYADRFLLKGALMLRVWDAPIARPTKDIDLLGRIEASESAIERAMRAIMELDVPDDGVRFDVSTLRTEAITLEAEYHGIRVHFMAQIGSMRLGMQVDIGFGDAVSPAAAWIDFPVLLNFPPPRVLAYPVEAAVAEKFNAIVELDMANSRMKDFYDLWLLSGVRAFEGKILAEAIQTTFDRRKTPLPVDVPTGLSTDFASNSTKQAQWKAFIRKTRLDGTLSLDAVLHRLRDFLMPPASARAKGNAFTKRWPPKGPWRDCNA